MTLRIRWLVVFGLKALSDSISVYIGPSSKEREKDEKKDITKYVSIATILKERS